MAFGFKLAPGIRVSTSGVRVGPRGANVRVGRGGARVSVGPRAARVHVGTRGVGVSSGLGPVSVSSWGARIGVGVGPAYVGVGTRTTRKQVGVGSVWFTTGSRSRRSNSGGSRSGPSDAGSSGSGQRHAVAQERIAAAGQAEYAAYMGAMRSAGVQRRNRYEIWAAGLNAYLNDMATLVAWASPFQPVSRPKVPPVPPLDVQREVAKQRLKEEGLYQWYRPGSATLVDEQAKASIAELKSSRAQAEEELTEAYGLFESVDPYMTLLVIQAVYSDNLLPAAPVDPISTFLHFYISAADNGSRRLPSAPGGSISTFLYFGGPRLLPAAPVDIDGSDLLVFMTFGDADRLIWPERFELLDSGLPGVSKMSDTEKNIRHLRVLLRCMTATAKEALATQPALSSVRIVALDEHSNEPLHLRPVYGDATFTRDILKLLSPRGGWETPWNNLVNTWLQTGGSYDEGLEQLFITFVTNYNDDLLEAETRLYSEALGQIAFSQEGRKDELKAFGKLGDFFPSEVLETLEVSEIAEDGAYLEAQSPADVSDYEFWLDALELRKAWRTEAGETETVEQSAPDEEIPETERAKESSIILSEDPRRDEGPTDTAPEATDLTTFSDRLGAIEELADLADVGILTPNEFQKKKQQILGGPGA